MHACARLIRLIRIYSRAREKHYILQVERIDIVEKLNEYIEDEELIESAEEVERICAYFMMRAPTDIGAAAILTQAAVINRARKAAEEQKYHQGGTDLMQTNANLFRIASALERRPLSGEHNG